MKYLQVRFDEIPEIYIEFEAAKSELELLDDTDYSLGMQQFEDHYFVVQARFNELLHTVVEQLPSRHNSPRSSVSGNTNNSFRSNIKLPTIAFTKFDGDLCSWLQYRDTFEALIVNNTALSNIQKFHYLYALLKLQAKGLINNFQVINENIIVAWQLVTQRYKNKQLIAMRHAKHLCKMPHVKKGDATSLRKLINHVSSHMNALQA